MEFSSTPLLPTTLALLLLVCLAYLFRCHPKSRTSGPLVKSQQLMIQGLPFLEWTTKRLLASPDATITFPGYVITSDPAVIEHVLKTNFPNYPKGFRSTSSMADLLGDGIFNTDGPHWQLQRKFASRGFNSRSLRFYLTDVINPEITDRLLPFLSGAAAALRTVDIQNVLERFAFDAVCRVAIGFDPALLTTETIDANTAAFRIARSFESAMAIVVNRSRPHLWRISRFVGIGDEARLKEEIAIVDDFAMRLVVDAKKRRTNVASAAKFSDSLIAPFIDAGGFEDKFLRDIVINYIFAGRDSTSSALTWFFFLISSRPAVRERILDEIISVRLKSGKGSCQGLYEPEELKEMEYLHAAITEAMRLYPPVPLDQRNCAEGDELPRGRKLKKGVTVIFNLYAMGRMVSVWGGDCRDFKPERWLDEKGMFQPGSSFRFPIFFAGPRACLGKEMAYMQMKAVAAAMLERFEFELIGEEERKTEGIVVLRMKGGLSMRVIRRGNF